MRSFAIPGARLGDGFRRPRRPYACVVPSESSHAGMNLRCGCCQCQRSWGRQHWALLNLYHNLPQIVTSLVGWGVQSPAGRWAAWRWRAAGDAGLRQITLGLSYSYETWRDDEFKENWGGKSGCAEHRPSPIVDFPSSGQRERCGRACGRVSAR